MPEYFRVTLTGTRALLMHNGRLADPQDPVTKALAVATSKQASKRTDEDQMEIAHLEWLGGIYHDETVGPYIPAANIERSLLDAARLTRKGKEIERGLVITSDVNPVAYQGPRDLDGLWADENYRLRVTGKNPGQKARIVRVRPRFAKWAVEAEGMYDPGQLDLEDLAEYFDSAGRLIGLGDWRPRYGRYDATVEAMTAAQAA